jgi:hypothetical protein
MVASRRSVALLTGIVLAACATSDPDGSGQSESTVAVSAEQRPADPGSAAGERRVTIEQLSDPTINHDLSEYTGVDLGTERPPANLAFCDAVAGAPGRWLNGSIVPLQFWIDSYSGVRDAPPVAAEAIVSLLSYGRERIDWNLGRAERPEFSAELAAHLTDGLLSAQHGEHRVALLGLRERGSSSHGYMSSFGSCSLTVTHPSVVDAKGVAPDATAG